MTTPITMNDHENFPFWLDQPYKLCRRVVPGAMQSETIPVEDALTRVTAADVFAPENVPPVPLAAVEGYAMRASDTAHAAQGAPVELEFQFSRRALASPAGSPAARAIGAQCAVDVPPYFPLPENADAVVPKSDLEVSYRGARSFLLLHAPLSAGQHVIAPGSEFRQGNLLLPRGSRITAERQIALTAAGVRDTEVTKRPRIGVVIVGYEQCATRTVRERWQRPDTSGPYIRAVLQRWGYEVGSVEYIEPPDMARPPLEVQQNEYAFKKKLAELAQRYDLIVGAGLPAVPPFRNLGLNMPLVYAYDETTVDIKQTPADRFNFGRSDNRSPPKKTMVTLTRPDGTQGGTTLLTSYDQATLINLPGHTSAVAMLMHAIMPRVLDSLEHASTLGPHWESGIVDHGVERDARLNVMRWGNLHRGVDGNLVVRLLPSEADGLIGGVVRADVLVAIPAGEFPLAAGSSVLFLRLDRDLASEPPRPVAEAAVEAAIPSPVVDARVTTRDTDDARNIDLRETWRQLEAAFAADASRLPGGLNGPASDDEIAALQTALGTQLPDAFVDSLRVHDGQADSGNEFSGSDALLSAHEILAQWRIWKGLVDGGDFDGMESEPDPGIRDDWYNLKWIPFTHDGSGNHLCIDLDPAEDGFPGQVIRVWHDDARRERIAGSFSAWLVRVADEGQSS
ncbi:SMI1/KNR4 family protein [Burkholderia contaminans]|uniref:SMI1/KNR4 family protein n=1 Tax=Burkholderia contaminans TaxID=488447 RepID=UPI001F4649B2|nr:SMI1/KNR4 family protein [Burkholderia contaminans]MEB4632965.1 SMI1/KNR4 family protein [Burkholderia contaminans]MEB4640573.1 SMI1/KNR4 family protein [Burkholderia contaminans]MEB4655565.1 SMI1/KNR4 family protein [Burkholderia contaminans]MEB4663867.1 SMI1/KNR4 family protein [Burkholderia contaminans]MEB4670471.1 SMI1/KNR4 family protein [Burkholderia contaminans]